LTQINSGGADTNCLALLTAPATAILHELVIAPAIILRQTEWMSLAMVNIREGAHAVAIFDQISNPKSVDRALQAAGLNRNVLNSETGFLPYYCEAVIFEFVARALGDPHIAMRGV